ncbi:MAG: hypothetical protein OXE57_20975 [Alphaproteobacteria bacterium]|nr:hypothetical protein [Alphaproteobacteria bacterium]
MWVRKWKRMCWALGLSVALSGCLKIEATTTVLEDGRVIDNIEVQPKNSLLALLALSARGVNSAGPGSDRAASRSAKEFKQILQELRTGNACKLADRMYEEALAKQKIPYSTVSVPTDFEFSGITGNGCKIQIGPYDPRTLPSDFAEEVLGIRVEPATGLHEPYRMSFVSFDEALDDIRPGASMDVAKLQASCSGELDPALCQQELRTLMVLIGTWNMEGNESGKLRDILSGPEMLGGTAEILRMVLKSVPVTRRIPDNTAVSMFPETWNFRYGQGWFWRGSAIEWITGSTNPGVSLRIRPTRRPTPSTR